MTLDDTNVIESLVKLGLNPREAKLYYALLRTPEATPAELDRLSSVPRTKVYEVLGQMAAKGLCSERQEGNKKYYRATSPSEVGAQLRASWETEHKSWQRKQRKKFDTEREKWVKKRDKMESELEKHDSQHRERRDTAGDVFLGLDTLFKNSLEQNPTLENAKIIRSTDQIRHLVLKSFQECKSEFLEFSRSPYLASEEKNRAEQDKALHGMLARGVTMKDVYMDEPSERHWMRPFTTGLAEAGAVARFADDLPIKMILTDREKAMIALPSVPGITSSDFTMLLLDDPGFVRACCKLFDTYWEEGYSLEDWLKK